MLKYVLNNATVITPMVYAGNKIVNFSFSSELFFNASDYSLDNEELFLVYGSNLRLFESKNRIVSFGLDLKGIDKRTERDSSFDTTADQNETWEQINKKFSSFQDYSSSESMQDIYKNKDARTPFIIFVPKISSAKRPPHRAEIILAGRARRFRGLQACPHALRPLSHVLRRQRR